MPIKSLRKTLITPACISSEFIQHDQSSLFASQKIIVLWEYSKTNR